MRTDSFSVRFFLRPEKKSKAGYPIYARVTINRRRTLIRTKQVVKDVHDWDPTVQRVVQPRSMINIVLTDMEASLTSIYNELRFTDKSITVETIKERFLGNGPNSVTIMEYFEKHFNERVKDNAQFSDGTVKNYRATFNHLNAYIKEKRLDYMRLKDVNESFIRNLDQYLVNTKVYKGNELLKRNTINKYHKKFKAVLTVAYKEGIISRNPYITVNLKDEPGLRTFLTKLELKAIEEHDLCNNESLRRVRDIFLFSVYTGLRFTDAQLLTKEHVEFDGQRYWLTFIQQKTRVPLRIPMLSPAKRIYDKYFMERELTGFVLPRLSNQKLNTYLKTIADLAGIRKKLTHHVARHTNATTVLLANGVSMEVVSRQLGHMNIKTTQLYARVTNDLLADAADMVEERMKNM